MKVVHHCVLSLRCADAEDVLRKHFGAPQGAKLYIDGHGHVESIGQLQLRWTEEIELPNERPKGD